MATMAYNQQTQMATCYINGQVVGTLNVSGKILMADAIHLTLGGQSPWQFTGLVDDTRIYSRALSAAEVQEIYNAGK